MSRKLTAEQRQQSDERRAHFRELVKRVAAMCDAERSQLAAKMIGVVSADAGIYSPRNQCLLAMQMPHATVVGGFRQWLAHGRCVKRGEHGAMIWFPSKRKADPDACAAVGVDPDSQPDETRFLIGTVFDISQTEPAAALAA